MTASTSDILRTVLSGLERQSTVTRVWLFGSRARGDHGVRSDIDLAVEAPTAGPREWDEIAEIVENAPTLLGIDLVRLDTVSEALQMRVRREGRLLLER